MGESEGTRRAFACLEATVVLGPVLVPVGRDRDHTGRRPGNEGPDAAGREGRSHRDLAGLDLGPVRERERGSGLDAFGDAAGGVRVAGSPQSTAQPAALCPASSLADFFGSRGCPSGPAPSSALPAPPAAT